ncbi:MAG: hypothetical protein AAGF97_18125 [Planctomycetota bacterium]
MSQVQRRALWILCGWLLLALPAFAADAIVHDAEYYILEAQNGNKWSAEDQELDERLRELREQYGAPPNIVHIMWDDTAYGDVGIPAIQKVRGFETPHLNQMATEGILFLPLLHGGGLYSQPRRVHDWPAPRAERDVQHRHAPRNAWTA